MILEPKLSNFLSEKISIWNAYHDIHMIYVRTWLNVMHLLTVWYYYDYCLMRDRIYVITICFCVCHKIWSPKIPDISRDFSQRDPFLSADSLYLRCDIFLWNISFLFEAIDPHLCSCKRIRFCLSLYESRHESSLT